MKRRPSPRKITRKSKRRKGGKKDKGLKVVGGRGNGGKEKMTGSSIEKKKGNGEG